MPSLAVVSPLHTIFGRLCVAFGRLLYAVRSQGLANAFDNTDW